MATGSVSGRAAAMGVVLGGGMFALLSASGFSFETTATLLADGPRLNGETAKWCLSVLTAAVPMLGSWLAARFPAVGTWRSAWLAIGAAGEMNERVEALEGRLKVLEDAAVKGAVRRKA